MRYSNLFTKTSKDVPHDADSVNAQLLTRAGFIHQEIAGVYSYLPLGLIVLRKIEAIIRNEMYSVGGQELLMPALTPKSVWEKTDRWNNFDALFRFKGMGDKEYALGATHEEIITPLANDYTFSYKDLPYSVFQIQNKFRNEPRAKSGLLRGREFSMKDLYSFHTTKEDLDDYYEIVLKAYLEIFKKLGFNSDITYVTYASGGAFSKFSHEFQAISDVGEDTIYCCDKCRVAINKEIINVQKTCPKCDSSDLVEKKGIEIGNIFKLGTKFSDAFGLKYADKNDEIESVKMGCYGIGPSRIMGALVEIHNDENGMIWPKSVTPFNVHMVTIGNDENVIKKAEELYSQLEKEGITVLYDDREERPGAKLKDADLIGIPVRLVISNRTLEKDGVEWKERTEKDAKDVKLDNLIAEIKKYYS